MVTDTDTKDEAILETDKSDTGAVTDTDTLKTEQSSAPSEISKETIESASQSNSLPSSESDAQPSTDTKSEIHTQDEVSNQSEEKCNTDQSETGSNREVTPSEDSNQTEGSSSRKSPAFDMSNVKIKEERTESTESGKYLTILYTYHKYC